MRRRGGPGVATGPGGAPVGGFLEFALDGVTLDDAWADAATGAFESPPLSVGDQDVTIAQATELDGWDPRRVTVRLRGGQEGVRVALTGGRAIVASFTDAATGEPILAANLGAVRLTLGHETGTYWETITPSHVERVRREVPHPGAWTVEVSTDGFTGRSGVVAVSDDRDAEVVIPLRRHAR